MRLAPVPLYFANDPEVAIARAADSSRTTHGAREAIDACRYLAGLIIGALQDRSKDDLLAALHTGRGPLDREPLALNINDIAAGSFLRREPRKFKGPATWCGPSRQRCGHLRRARRSSTALCSR